MSKRITNIVFKRSTRKGKKYRVEFNYGGKRYVRHFGALGYQQYKDSTPIRLYRLLDHNDKQRRKRYYQRHGLTKNPLSAKYWSNKYLW